MFSLPVPEDSIISFTNCSGNLEPVLTVVVPRPHTESYIIVGRVSTLLLIYQTDVSLPSNE